MKFIKISDIKKQVDKMITKHKVSQAHISRLLDINQNTFNGWLTERVTCRHLFIVHLALEALDKRMESLYK
jgi:predicted XRE-type DNA-binding protein